jgi:GntR family transcriptional repressor for pyruvate dehydrogenase complex
MPTNTDGVQFNQIFNAVAREPTLADRVTKQLENLIIANQLQPGDRLPSERELARQFGVSRTVIREAVRALVATSLLDVQSGSGTVVRNPTTETVSKSVSLLLRRGGVPVDYSKVNEVRRLLEIEIAGLAAERRNEEDLLKLETVVQDMKLVQNKRDEFAQNDVNFHLALAEATHNELFVVLLDSLSDIMLVVRQTGFNTGRSPSHAIDYHERIYQSVRDQNVSEARHLMSEHLDISEQIFRAGLAMPQVQDPPTIK